MPKKNLKETPTEQSVMLRAEAQKQIDAGEIAPTEADKVLNKLVRLGSASGPRDD